MATKSAKGLCLLYKSVPCDNMSAGQRELGDVKVYSTEEYQRDAEL
ncbi:hypothetical protein SP19_179 [Salmonella phage 19]|nr:hypothetical protein SP19_179 [Salmonella phage 19]